MQQRRAHAGKQPERLITADWGAPRDEVFPVDVVVEAMDRQGLLRDVTEVFSREKINVTAANTLTRNLQARMAFTLEVRSLDQLKRALGWSRTCRACFPRRAAEGGAAPATKPAGPAGLGTVFRRPTASAPGRCPRFINKLY